MARMTRMSIGGFQQAVQQAGREREVELAQEALDRKRGQLASALRVLDAAPDGPSHTIARHRVVKLSREAAVLEQQASSAADRL